MFFVFGPLSDRYQARTLAVSGGTTLALCVVAAACARSFTAFEPLLALGWIDWRQAFLVLAVANRRSGGGWQGPSRAGGRRERRAPWVTGEATS